MVLIDFEIHSPGQSWQHVLFKHRRRGQDDVLDVLNSIRLMNLLEQLRIADFNNLKLLFLLRLVPTNHSLLKKTELLHFCLEIFLFLNRPSLGYAIIKNCWPLNSSKKLNLEASWLTWWNVAIDFRYSRCRLGADRLGSNSRQPTTSKIVSSANISSKRAFLFWKFHFHLKLKVKC